MSEQKSLEHIVTRKDFFKMCGKSLLHISGLIALNVGAGAFRAFNNFTESRAVAQKSGDIKTYNKHNDDNKNNDDKSKNDDNYKLVFQVKHFASQIYHSSQKIDKHDNAILYGIGAFTLGDFTGSLALLNNDERLKSIVGGSSLALGKIIDLYSTYKFAEVMEHSKFREYGLHNYFFENNPFFSQDPTRREVVLKGVVLTGISYLIGRQFPWFGTGYLALSPFVAVNNLDCRARMIYALKLGEDVEKLLPDNDYPSIVEYIGEMNPKRMLLNTNSRYSQ